MSDNYAVINGKRIELTDEQVKTLGIERKNPFDRVERYTECYCINSSNIVERSLDTHSVVDNNRYEVANYFNDEAFAKQVALHQLLYRKLLKFTYDNGFEDTVWNNKNEHWYIYYNYVNGYFDSQCNDSFKSQNVYFSSAGAANRAICEVVMPFVKEHPEFIW